MEGADLLTTFQVRVARIFFGLKASEGFVVAGGAALLASDLVSRPTQDLDLFASTPIVSVAEAKAALIRALKRRGCSVVEIHDSPTFCRLVVADGTDQVLVDLAIDSPPMSPPTLTLLGPTLVPLELAGRKLLALFGRAEARDFADVYVLAQHFSMEDLLNEAARLDPGFDRTVLAQMVATLDRFTDADIPLPSDTVLPARAFFSRWASELATNHETS